MRKVFLTALLAFSLSSNAQTQEKEVTLSLRHFELFSILKQSNSFSRFQRIPEKVKEVYNCDKLQYILAENDQYILHIMPDNEFIFYMKKPMGSAGVISNTFYIRFPQDKIFGYEFSEYPDETRVMVYQDKKFVHKDEIKAKK